MKTEWWGAGVVICLERGADLHTAQLMPLPLTVSCFSKIQIGLTSLLPAYPGSTGQSVAKRVCACKWKQCLHVERHEILARDEADDLVVVVDYHKMTQAESPKDDVGTIERVVFVDLWHRHVHERFLFMPSKLKKLE